MKSWWIDSIGSASPCRNANCFSLLIGRRLVGHLAVQDLDAVEPEPGGILDHLLDKVLFGAEVPVGISRDGDLDARLRAASRRLRPGRPAASGVGERPEQRRAPHSQQFTSRRMFHGSSSFERQ
jgi:hypothetical protein